MTTFSIGPTIYRPDLPASTDGLTPYASDAEIAQERLERVRAVRKAAQRLAEQLQARSVVGGLVERKHQLEHKSAAAIESKFRSTGVSMRLVRGKRGQPSEWLVEGGDAPSQGFAFGDYGSANKEARRRARG